MIRKQNNKLLIISYAFPPISGGGIFRVVKFAKYLPSFGWIPQVLTVKEGFSAFTDKSLLKEIPVNVKISRLKYTEPGLWFKSRLWQSLLSYYLYPIICFPDKRIFWAWPALKSAYKIIKQEKIKVIFTSSSSVTDHLVALILKKILKIKWVADFRDEWASSNYIHFPTPLHRYCAKILEKKIVNTADRIITVSEPITEQLKRLSTNKTKFITITNGFDKEDYQQCRHTSKGRYCRMLHVGSLYGSRQANTFLRVVKKLGLKNLKYEFIGRDIRVAHKEAVKLMCSADILLLILSPDDHEGVYTGKIYEYLAAGRPILALAPSSSGAAKLIKKYHAGQVVDPRDEESIKSAVNKLYQKWQENNFKPQKFNLDSFERRNLTKRLSCIFDELITTEKQLKVCLVANSCSPQSQRLCQYLIGRRYIVHFISLDGTRISGVENHSIKQLSANYNFSFLTYSLGFINKLFALVKLKKLIKKIGPDIVHGHGINFSGILAVMTGFHPVIITTRGSDVMQIDKQIKPEQYLIKRTLKKADLVTGSSEALKNQSLKLGMPLHKYRMLYFGVNTKIFKPFEQNVISALRRKFGVKDEKIIFCPRSIKPIYNIDILIQAVAMLNIKFKLILIKQNYNPDYLKRIDKLIQEKKLKDKVIILPPSDESGIAKLYNLADVVVSIAKSDGLAVSFLEAMACEKKIVISNVGFAKEWLRTDSDTQEKNFWIVPINDAMATSSAIDLAIKMPKSQFSGIGRRNRQLIVEKVEINKAFQEIDNIYKDLIYGY